MVQWLAAEKFCNSFYCNYDRVDFVCGEIKIMFFFPIRIFLYEPAQSALDEERLQSPDLLGAQLWNQAVVRMDCLDDVGCSRGFMKRIWSV